MNTRIRIATRASQLALAQAEMVKAALIRAHDGLDVSILPMTTSGDRNQTDTLAQWGYKGLFTKELEEALLNGDADIAVHSMKDMPSILPDGLMIAAMMPREDARDAFVSTRYARLADLPQGAVVGTSSVRRSSLLRALRPDVRIVPFRGNVNTRLQKLADGEVDATLLAVAGLKRLGLESHIREALPMEVMLPAVAQGAIGIECRSEDERIQTHLRAISHAPTVTCVEAERALLLTLDGSCKTPLSGYASLQGDRLHINGLIADESTGHVWRSQISGDATQGQILGTLLGEDLRQLAAKDGFTLNESTAS